MHRYAADGSYAGATRLRVFGPTDELTAIQQARFLEHENTDRNHVFYFPRELGEMTYLRLEPEGLPAFVIFTIKEEENGVLKAWLRTGYRQVEPFFFNQQSLR